MLLVQEFLKTHSLKDLYDLHGVSFRPSEDKTKFSLNYDQIAAKPGDPIADECRGLILRMEPIGTPVDHETEIIGETSIVARPMDRFYNAGDPIAVNIDWNDKFIRIQEKLDGTMCIVYFDRLKNQWCVATRAVPEADILFDGDKITPLVKNTFYELFKYSVIETILGVYIQPKTNDFRIDNHIFPCWLDELDKEVTYLYELTSPLNRVVVKYDDYRVTLLAARVTLTGEYKEYELGYGPALLKPQEWSLQNFDSLVEFVNKCDPAKIEGAVVVDRNYNRQKVKSKAWVMASRAKDLVSLSRRNALEAIIDGTIDDVIPLLSEELVVYIESMRANLVLYCVNIDSMFLICNKQETRKEFALAVKSSGFWESPFFSLYSGQYKNTLEWLKHLAKEKRLLPSTIDVLLKNIMLQS